MISKLKNQKEKFKNKLKINRDNEVYPQATFMEFTDPAKLYALEGIYEQASAVFGPFGGIFSSIYTSEATKQTVLSKSSDGHKFFESLNFQDIFVQNGLCSVREKTLYVSGSNGKTSRDGTTSLALISSAVSSDMLVSRMAEPNKFKIPSSIVHSILSNISENFRRLVDERKQLIYIPEKLDYVEGGQKAAMDAIATTTAMNPIFIDAYSNLMETCKAQGIDITESSVLAFPEKEITSGNVGFEIRVNGGLKLSASPLIKIKRSTIKESKAPIVIMDGFLGEGTYTVVEPILRKFLTNLLSMTDENGLNIYSKYNNNGIDAPVIFYNRSTPELMRLFESYQEGLVTATCRDAKTNQTLTEKICPRFLLVQSEDTEQEKYDLLKEIYSESVIDLNGIRRLVLDEARKFIPDELKIAQGNTPYSDEFDKASNSIEVKNKIKLTFDKGKVVKPLIDFDSSQDGLRGDSVVSNKISEPVNLFNTISIVNFDGTNLFLKPMTEDVTLRAKENREAIIEAMKDHTKCSAEFENIERVKGMFAGATFTPIFYVKTEDEYSILYDVYQDAQGIFESVHTHGVMAGGNVTLFKLYERLEEAVLKDLEATFDQVKLSENRKELYMNFAKESLDSLFRGYYRVYKTLLQESDEVVEEKVNKFVTELKDDMLTSYNIVTDKFDKKVLESTRTTVDTFQAALDVLEDTLRITRVRLQKEGEALMMTRDFPKENFKISKSTSDYYEK